MAQRSITLRAVVRPVSLADETRTYRLAPGVLVLIEHGETHEIRNNGKEPLETLNFYVPPAYNKAEEELPAGKSS
jgi:mannose-6-phosphate isomerase-like protein (cupin superfamily)